MSSLQRLIADGSEGKPYFVKRFGLSARYERRFFHLVKRETFRAFWRETSKTQWAIGGAEAAVQTGMCAGTFLFWVRPFGRCHLTKILPLSGSRSLRESIRKDTHESSTHRLAEQIARRLADILTQWQWFL